MKLNPNIIVRIETEYVSLLNTDTGQQYQLGSNEYSFLANHDSSHAISPSTITNFSQEEQARLLQLLIKYELLVPDSFISKRASINWESIIRIKLCTFWLGDWINRFADRIRTSKFDIYIKWLRSIGV